MRRPAPGQRPVTSVEVVARITSGAGWSPWRTVVGFGVVSLAADMVYEGARSVTGPLLASLGASALLVGLVSGAGEATALLMRVIFGSWADRSGRYWTLTFAGYGLTAICVPALAVTPFLAGCWFGPRLRPHLGGAAREGGPQPRQDCSARAGGKCGGTRTRFRCAPGT